MSLRSVYVHFDDLEDLFLAAAKRHVELISGMLVEVPDTGPLRSRAETMVRMRSRIWEEVGNILRAAALQEPFSPTLARWLAGGAQGHEPRHRARSSPRSSSRWPSKTGPGGWPS